MLSAVSCQASLFALRSFVRSPSSTLFISHFIQRSTLSFFLSEEFTTEHTAHSTLSRASIMVGISVLQQVSKARNGVGAFVLPCKRITMTYCNFGGSSAGMRDFLRMRLAKFAQQHPGVEIRVLEKPGKHPVITGEYATPNAAMNAGSLKNGNATKQICVRKWNIDVIENKLNILLNSSGKKLSKPKHTVVSENPSVRGIWSPFYVDPAHRFKI